MNFDLKQLGEPFPLDNPKTGQRGVGFKAQVTTKDGTKAMAVPYIDARDVQQRLDDVVGPQNWKCDFTPLGDGNVLCCLSIKIDGEWVGKQDVGGPSDQPDGGDRIKAAFSEALKRAAVQWNIGRYLYTVPMMWVGYDAQKKQLTEVPSMPAWALPAVKHPQPQTQAKATTSPPPAPTQAANTQAAPAPDVEAVKDAETDDLLKKLDACQTKQALDLVRVLLKSRVADLGPSRAARLRAKYSQVDSKFTPPQATNVAQAAKEVLGAVPVSAGGPPFGVE